MRNWTKIVIDTLKTDKDRKVPRGLWDGSADSRFPNSWSPIEPRNPQFEANRESSMGRWRVTGGKQASNGPRNHWRKELWQSTIRVTTNVGTNVQKIDVTLVFSLQAFKFAGNSDITIRSVWICLHYGWDLVLTFFNYAWNCPLCSKGP